MANSAIISDITELKGKVDNMKIQTFRVSSSTPFELPLSDYGSAIFLGFIQCVGAAAVLTVKNTTTVSNINMTNGSDWKVPYFDIHVKSGDSNTLEITSTASGESTGTVIYSV